MTLNTTNRNDSSLALATLAARLEQSEVRYRRAERRLRVMGSLCLGGLCLSVTLPIASPAVAQGYGVTLAQLLNRVIVLETKTASMSTLIDPETNQPTVRFEGVNVQIVDGTGDTLGLVTGLGNLIIGYNEKRNDGSDIRAGNHNLIVGVQNNYAATGGFVVGLSNSINGGFSTVTGGIGNTASGGFSSVSGGGFNTASGSFSSVSGGTRNTSSGSVSSVSGGEGNTASGTSSSVSGGLNHTASGANDWRAGDLSQDL